MLIQLESIDSMTGYDGYVAGMGLICSGTRKNDDDDDDEDHIQPGWMEPEQFFFVGELSPVLWGRLETCCSPWLNTT